MKKNNEKGFSLVELLVVVIIIAIVAAIAIPNLLASRRAANEASAISSLRTIHSAEATYFGTLGNNLGYADLTALSNAILIDSTLGGGSKSGYTFTASVGAGQIYCANAARQSTSSGTNFFGVSQTGVIMKHNLAITCAAGVLGSGGSPIE